MSRRYRNCPAQLTERRPLRLAPPSRRLASLVYEALLLAAFLWLASLFYSVAEQQLDAPHVRSLYQAYLTLVAGIYFVWQWVRGQTLPMKTWRMRLVAKNGSSVNVQQGAIRYVLAIAGLVLVGTGFLWALFDPEGQFLHDRLAGTRFVSC